ncbi:MAG: hypothetical protein JST04_02290 [Bdellovibrionales bacterium]|nr:hypothetical protein [Bdellovibrionales bacterium]
MSRSAAVFLALAYASGCGGARVVHIPTTAAPTIAQSIQETNPSSIPPTTSEGSPAAEAPASVPAPADASNTPPSEGRGSPVTAAPSSSVIVDDYPEDEEEGPAEIVVVAPLQSQVEYRFDGDDPVPAAPSFDVGAVPEGEHTIEVQVIPPVGTPEKFEFAWKQIKRYDPDEPVDDRELDRRAKRREARKAKREAKKKEREERKRAREAEKAAKKDEKKETDSKGKNSAERPEKGRSDLEKRDDQGRDDRDEAKRVDDRKDERSKRDDDHKDSKH